MSFNIVLEKTSSDRRVLEKTIKAVGTVTGSFRDETSITNPEIMINGDITDFALCNHLKIPVMGRSYWIESISSYRTGLFIVRAHVDVLETYKDQIKSSQGIVRRQSVWYDRYVNDGAFRTHQNQNFYQKTFAESFDKNNDTFILTVAGE